MAAKRRTSNDYKSEYKELKNKEAKLRKEAIQRANELIKQYPDVQVGQYTLKDYGTFENYSMSDAILIIETVEKHLAALHPHQQSIIDWATSNPKKVIVKVEDIHLGLLPTPDMICNCDARDMPVYEDEGKRWCPQCGYQVI